MENVAATVPVPFFRKRYQRAASKKGTGTVARDAVLRGELDRGDRAIPFFDCRPCAVKLSGRPVITTKRPRIRSGPHPNAAACNEPVAAPKAPGRHPNRLATSPWPAAAAAARCCWCPSPTPALPAGRATPADSPCRDPWSGCCRPDRHPAEHRAGGCGRPPVLIAPSANHRCPAAARRRCSSRSSPSRRAVPLPPGRLDRRRMHVNPVGDEIDRAARIGQNRLDRAHRSHARFRFFGRGKNVIKMRGVVVPASIARCVCSAVARVCVIKGTIPRRHKHSMTGRMFGTSGLIDMAATRPPAAASSSSKSPISPGTVSPRRRAARNGPSMWKPGMQTSSTADNAAASAPTRPAAAAIEFDRASAARRSCRIALAVAIPPQSAPARPRRRTAQCRACECRSIRASGAARHRRSARTSEGCPPLLRQPEFGNLSLPDPYPSCNHSLSGLQAANVSDYRILHRRFLAGRAISKHNAATLSKIPRASHSHNRRSTLKPSSGAVAEGGARSPSPAIAGIAATRFRRVTRLVAAT